MLLMISLKNLTVGVRLWNSRFVLRSIILSASADLLPILSVARNRRLSMWRKPLFRLNISRHTPCLTGRGFLYLSLSHPAPKNRNEASLALPLAYQGENAQAEAESRELLQPEEKIQGYQHPDTLRISYVLGLCLAREGKIAEEKKFARMRTRIFSAIIADFLGKNSPFQPQELA